MRRIDQSVDRQIAALEHIRKRGDLHTVGFAIEMSLPPQHRGRDGKRYAAAECPPGRIPYVLVVDAWFVSMALAELLAELFARDNPGSKIEFYPALCNITDESFYVYGQDDPQ